MGSKGAVSLTLVVIIIVVVISAFTIFSKFSINSPFGKFGNKPVENPQTQTRVSVKVAYVNPFDEINPKSTKGKNPFADNPVEDLLFEDQK